MEKRLIELKNELFGMHDWSIGYFLEREYPKMTPEEIELIRNVIGRRLIDDMIKNNVISKMDKNTLIDKINRSWGEDDSYFKKLKQAYGIQLEKINPQQTSFCKIRQNVITGFYDCEGNKVHLRVHYNLPSHRGKYEWDVIEDYNFEDMTLEEAHACDTQDYHVYKLRESLNGLEAICISDHVEYASDKSFEKHSEVHSAYMQFKKHKENQIDKASANKEIEAPVLTGECPF